MICGAALAAGLASCNGSKGWSVEGRVADAPKDCKVALEGYNNGRWYLIDSLAVDSKGKFSYSAAEPLAYAEIMRVTLSGAGSIYFPVDGKEKLTVSTVYDKFATAYTIAGDPMCAAVWSVDSIVRAHSDAAAAAGAAAIVSPELSRELANVITQDTTGLVAYYALGKSVGGKLIFNPTENFGNRVYGAAAQVYATYHPEDPRGKVLFQAYTEGRRIMGKLPQAEAETVIEVPEAGTIDITRYDAAGREHSLSELAKEGKVVLLSFTAYGLPASPAYNAILNDLYELYHSKGLEIYQIAFDAEEVAWKQAAANLPWVAVWNSPADGEGVLYSYNVGALPMTYVIDRKGDIAARVVDPTELPKTVGKYF